MALPVDRLPADPGFEDKSGEKAEANNDEECDHSWEEHLIGEGETLSAQKLVDHGHAFSRSKPIKVTGRMTKRPPINGGFAELHHPAH